MPPKLDFEFTYQQEPVVSVTVYSPFTGRLFSTDALIDTGAEVSMFDIAVAQRLGIDLTRAPSAGIVGVGGRVEARLAEVELRLMDNAELRLWLEVAFVAGQTQDLGNLIGLDVLSHFDFGLSHRSPCVPVTPPDVSSKSRLSSQ